MERSWSLVSVLLVFTVAGCGMSTSDVRESNEEDDLNRYARGVGLSSPALERGGRISPGYRCSSSSVWLPLEWGDLPTGTAEVVVVINIEHGIRQSPRRSHPPKAEWLIGGISPGLERINFGPVPAGAYLVQISREPRCPTQNEFAGMTFTLYAMPVRHSRSEFEIAYQDDIEAFRRIAIDTGTLAAVYYPES